MVYRAPCYRLQIKDFAASIANGSLEALRGVGRGPLVFVGVGGVSGAVGQFAAVAALLFGAVEGAIGGGD
ncbi:MAG: hypothetical protein Fur0042_21300 [Cyanophyceae cyanobacterium]